MQLALISADALSLENRNRTSLRQKHHFSSWGPLITAAAKLVLVLRKLRLGSSRRTYFSFVVGAIRVVAITVARVVSIGTRYQKRDQLVVVLGFVKW